jgi:hypothetical protein
LTHPWRVGFTSSVDMVFISGAGVLTLALVLSLLARELPLQGTTGTVSAPRSGAAETERVPEPAESEEGRDGSGDLVGTAARRSAGPSGQPPSDPSRAATRGERAAAPPRGWQPTESPHPGCPVSLDQVRAHRERPRQPSRTGKV